MTDEVMRFVQSLGLSGKTLDVGSLNVNGSVRALFQDYVGVDMRSGESVDHVMNGHALVFPDDQFDTVLCLETLEHDDAFWLTVAELRRVLRAGGRLVITVPGFGYPRHDYPSDYWRFSDDAVRLFYDGMSCVSIVGEGGALMAHGIKP